MMMDGIHSEMIQNTLNMHMQKEKTSDEGVERLVIEKSGQSG